jgi:hypothetical protein
MRLKEVFGSVSSAKEFRVGLWVTVLETFWRREEAHCDACRDARTDAQATVTSTQDSNSEDGIMETPIDKEREAVRSLKEELTVCREQLATLKRLLSECIQNNITMRAPARPPGSKKHRRRSMKQARRNRTHE